MTSELVLKGGMRGITPAHSVAVLLCDFDDAREAPRLFTLVARLGLGELVEDVAQGAREHTLDLVDLIPGIYEIVERPNDR